MFAPQPSLAFSTRLTVPFRMVLFGLICMTFVLLAQHRDRTGFRIFQVA
jgi:hypothetical protein